MRYKSGFNEALQDLVDYRMEGIVDDCAVDASTLVAGFYMQQASSHRRGTIRGHMERDYMQALESCDIGGTLAEEHIPVPTPPLDLITNLE